MKGKLIVDRIEILEHYFKKKIIIDLITILPIIISVSSCDQRYRFSLLLIFSYIGEISKFK